MAGHRFSNRFLAYALFAGVLLTGLAGSVGAQEAPHDHSQHDARDVERLVRLLQAKPGSVLADIGAGDGVLTIPMARHVGAGGKVHATEIDRKAISELRRALRKAGAKNIVVVTGHADRTNLAPGCCDGIYMRNVYHHFDDPAAMNASLMRALKPGGRLAIIDFPPTREAANPADRDQQGRDHGVLPATVIRELTQAGFEQAVSEDAEHDAYIVVARKPAPTP